MPRAGKPPDVSSRGLVAAIIIVLFVITAAGTLLYQSQEWQIKDGVTRDLTSIALLKTDQIAAWREDRLNDARSFSSSPFFIDGVDHYLTYGDEESGEKILERFRDMNVTPVYDNILLVDPQGNVRLSLDPTITSIQPTILAQVNASLESGNDVLTDFHPIPGTNRPSLYAIAPLRLKTDGSEKPVGAVLLSINPYDFLYPLVQSWPVPSESAETLLVEREGDHVLYLNELRHQPNTALNLTIPLSRTDLPAVMAVLGRTGPFTGRDYRGIDVISVLEPIPGSPWFMVAKVDTEEAYAAWRSSAILIIALVMGSLAGALVIVGLVWQRRQKYYYRTLYAAEAERARYEIQNRERLETLLHLAEMESAGEQELADFVLDAGCRLTDSPLAFIGVMSPDESVLDITAWSKSAMKDCSVAASPIHFPIDKAGIWAEAVRQRKPLIVNDYTAPQQGKKGLPPEHVPITRFTSVPIFEGERIVMVCAVANKETGYTALDVDNLTLLMQGVWSHLQKKSADEALRQKTTDLEAAFEEITASEEELQANYEELARSQHALTESERKYRNLYHYAQVGLFETSFKDGTVVACNRQYAELAGFASAEEAIGKDILRLYVNPEERTEVGRILREQGYIENHTVKFRNQATGKLFWGQFSARFNYEREVAEGTIIDVTAQKEAETEIQNSKNFLDSIIEQSPNPIWISDEKGTLLRLNKACCDVLHITPEEVVGKYNVFNDSIVESQGKMPLVRSVFEEGKSVNFDLEFDSKLLTSLALEQFAKVFLNVTIFPIRDSAGRITNAVIQQLDFTDRKKAEADLVAAQQQYRELFENVNIGILRSTPGPQGTLVEANPAALRIFEADSREQFLALLPSDLYYDTDQRKKISEEILAKGIIKGIEIRYKSLKGKPIWGRISSIRKTSEDGTVYFDNTIDDITERKAAEEKIDTQYSLMNGVLESTDSAVFSLDRNYRYTSFNSSHAAFMKLLYGADIELGRSIFDYQSVQADKNTAKKNIDRALAGEQFTDKAYSGDEMRSRRFFEVTHNPVRDADQHVIGVAVFAQDITDRKRAEDVLRETAEYLNKLIDYANAPIIVWDPEFRITRFNHAFERLCGRSEQEVIRQRLDVLFPEESRDDSFALIRETLKDRRWENVRIPILVSDGTVRIVLWNSAIILTAEAELVSTIAQGVDITEIERAEAALRESEEKYRVLFTRMTEGSALHELMYDASGNPADYRILDVNPAFEHTLGIRREDVTGKTSRDAYGVDTPPFLGTYARVVATGQPEVFEAYFEPLKKYFSISVYSPEKGRFATIFEDITDRKQAEELQERLIRELEQKNAELERFTFTVSHDLKSPLITIKGFASLLEDDALTRDPVLLKKDIQRITKAAETMQTLLTDVFELARVGKVVRLPEKIPFGKIVHEAVDLLTGPLAERGVTIGISPDLPDVYVDHARIREVMVNLIENAVKFFGDQENPAIRIGVDRDGKTPVFFVQDNGIGIDPRYLERIFNLFEKLDASAHGTGVGLTIVRRIIETHGGKIWAESEGIGKGTTFRFTLPGPADKGEEK
jgi:PAS domain S-box-containing protein